jgi:hypothetical protein
MKKNLLKSLYLVALAAIIGMSCTKENATAPAPQTQTNNLNEDVVQSGEVSSAVVVPGIYSILKFVDTGDDITSQYAGYTFDFQSDGTLVGYQKWCYLHRHMERKLCTNKNGDQHKRHCGAEEFKRRQLEDRSYH